MQRDPKKFLADLAWRQAERERRANVKAAEKADMHHEKDEWWASVRAYYADALRVARGVLRGVYWPGGGSEWADTSRSVIAEMRALEEAQPPRASARERRRDAWGFEVRMTAAEERAYAAEIHRDIWKGTIVDPFLSPEDAGRRGRQR